MYAFSSKSSIATVLTQKDDEGKGEHLVAFYSWTLKEYEMNYNFVERQAFAIVKGLKNILHLISCNKVFVYDMHSSVREYIMEGEITEKRANWINKILEYEIEVKPTKTI